MLSFLYIHTLAHTFSGYPNPYYIGIRILMETPTESDSFAYEKYDWLTGQHTYVKVINRGIFEQKCMLGMYKINTLHKLAHENIVDRLDIKLTDGFYHIEFEFIQYSLDEYLELNHDKFKLIQQLLKGLIYLHQNKISHNYLQSQNIMVTSRGVLKIINFKKSVKYKNCTNEVYESESLLLKTLKKFPHYFDISSAGYVFLKILFESQFEADIYNLPYFKKSDYPENLAHPLNNIEFRNYLETKNIKDEFIEFFSSIFCRQGYDIPTAENLLQTFEELEINHKSIFK
ncbi:CMGC/CDK protein kinase [Anncaliia algerae PRA339]|uniref:non-specific serine/threonine protein kinase n=1 Tax=Anncaliia algerae PRA339 TaxID=1288291 RepID=A0A059EXX3_9MICR|nr:CMGC/CDK protein kinase [Anncaliia algerae PRA339]